MVRPRTALFSVRYREQSGPAGPISQNLGHPSSAADIYRVASIVRTGHESWNSCYTDPLICAGLAPLVEALITSRADLRAAEAPLQVLMWHDRIDVLVPAIKQSMRTSAAYARTDDPRSRLAFEPFRPCVPYDQICAVERVEVQEGIIIESTHTASPIVGSPLNEVRARYLGTSKIQDAVLATIAVDMGVPAYFLDPHLGSFSGNRGFFGQFYSSVEESWDEAMAGIPDLESVVPLPPLLWIVLTRANNRSDIPATIADIRHELASVRAALLGLPKWCKAHRWNQRLSKDAWT